MNNCGSNSKMDSNIEDLLPVKEQDPKATVKFIRDPSGAGVLNEPIFPSTTVTELGTTCGCVIA